MAEGENQEEKRRTCFVIGPIGSPGSDRRIHADNLFHDVIVPALQPLGFEECDVIRADHLENPGSINDQVINLIFDADLIVADLSFHNPNAFYELGIADTAGKVVISFCRDGDSIPFDRVQDRTIIANIGVWQEKERARQQIGRFAEKALDVGFKVSNPVTHAKGFAELQTSADPTDKIISGVLRRLDDLESKFRIGVFAPLRRSRWASELEDPQEGAIDPSYNNPAYKQINSIIGSMFEHAMDQEDLIGIIDHTSSDDLRRIVEDLEMYKMHEPSPSQGPLNYIEFFIERARQKATEQGRKTF